MLADLDHVMHLTFGIHYTHANNRDTPMLEDEPEAFPGQRKSEPTWVGELGVRWQLYFPQSFGFFFEAARHFTIRGTDHGLTNWTYFSLGTTFSFGTP